MAEDDSMDLWFIPDDAKQTDTATTNDPSLPPLPSQSDKAQTPSKTSQKSDNKGSKRLGRFFSSQGKRGQSKHRRQLIEQIKQFAEQHPTPLLREDFDLEDLYEWETPQLESYLKWLATDKARRESLSFSAQLKTTEVIPKLKLLFIDAQLATENPNQQHHNINISTPDFSTWNPVVLEKYFHVLQSYKYYRDALDPNADYYYHSGLWHFCEWLYLRAKGIDPSRCFTMDASLVIKCLKETAEIPLDILEKRYRQDVRYFYGVPTFENGTHAELTRYIIRVEPLLRRIPNERQSAQKTGNTIDQGNSNTPHVSSVIRKRNCRPNIAEAFEDLAQMLNSQNLSTTPSQTHLLAQDVKAQVAQKEKATKAKTQAPPKTPTEKVASNSPCPNGEGGWGEGAKVAPQDTPQAVATPPELPKTTKKAKTKAELPEVPKTKAEITEDKAVPPKSKAELPEIPKTKAELPEIPKTKAELPEVPKTRAELPEVPKTKAEITENKAVPTKSKAELPEVPKTKAELPTTLAETPDPQPVPPKTKGKMPEMPKTRAKTKTESPDQQAVHPPELPKQTKKTKAAKSQADTPEVQTAQPVLPELPKSSKKAKGTKIQDELSKNTQRKSPAQPPAPPKKTKSAAAKAPASPPPPPQADATANISSIISLDEIDLEFQTQNETPQGDATAVSQAAPSHAPTPPDTTPKPQSKKPTKLPKEKKKANPTQQNASMPVCADGAPVVMTSKEARALKHQQQTQTESLSIDIPSVLTDDGDLEDKRTQRISMTKEIAALLMTEAPNLGLETQPKPSGHPSQHIAITTTLNQNYAFQMPCPISQLFADEIRKWIEETTPYDPYMTDYRKTIFKGILEFTQYFSPEDRFPLVRVCAEIPRILNTLPCLSMAQPDISRDMTWALFSALGFITGWASSLVNDESAMQLQLVQTWQRLHGKQGTDTEMYDQAMKSLGIVRNANRYHPMHWRIAFDMEPSQPDYRRFVSCIEGLIRWHKWNVPELPIFDPQMPLDNWCLAWSQALKADGYCIAEFRYLPSVPSSKRYIFLVQIQEIEKIQSLFAAYMQGEHLRIWL